MGRRRSLVMVMHCQNSRTCMVSTIQHWQAVLHSPPSGALLLLLLGRCAGSFRLLMLRKGPGYYALGRVPVRLLALRFRIVTEPKELHESGSVPVQSATAT